MILYNAFFKITKKNLLSILIYLGITVGIIALLSGIYKSKQDQKAVLDSYNIYVENHDQSEAATALVNYLSKIHKVSEEKMSEEAIRDNMYYEQIVTYVEIPEGFGETFLSTGENKVVNTYDDSMPVGISISLQIENFLSSMRGYMLQGDSVETASQKAADSLDIAKYVSIRADEGASNGGMRGAFNYIPFGILSVLISGIFPVVAGFNRGEKRNRIQVSSMPQGKKTMWILLAAATFAMMILVVLVAIATITGGSGVSVGNAPGSGTDASEAVSNGMGAFSGTWWLAVLNALVFTAVVAMMISMFSNVPFFAKAPAGALSTIVGLGLCFLGGTFVPLSILGDGVKAVSRFLPNYWYSVAVEKIFSGGGLADIWDCFLLQLVFGVACLFIGLAAARISAERAETA